MGTDPKRCPVRSVRTLLVVRQGAPFVAPLFLFAMPGAPIDSSDSSYLLLVVRSGEGADFPLGLPIEAARMV